MLGIAGLLGPTLAAVAVALWPSSSLSRAIAATARRRPAAAATQRRTSRSVAAGARARVLHVVRGRRRHDRPTEVTDEQALALLDALAPALAAGLTPAEALLAASSAVPDARHSGLLVPVIRAANDGRPLGPAWQRLAQRTGHPDVASLARAWSVSERLGCPLAEAVRQTARSCRDRTLVQQRLASTTAGTRATSTLLTLLPIGGTAMAPLLGLNPAQLYGTPVAWACLLLGGLLILLGRWIVGRMVGQVEAATR